jgi:hypothetical protein
VLMDKGCHPLLRHLVLPRPHRGQVPGSPTATP